MGEIEIQAEILEFLTHHPKVAFMRRYNSMYSSSSKGGKARWIRTVRAAKGIKFKQLDLQGMLVDGRTIACEVKKVGEKPDDEQWQEIHHINSNNGIAFWADSVKMAKEQMDNVMLQISVDDIC